MPMTLILDALFDLLEERFGSPETPENLGAIIVACIAGFIGSIVTLFALLFFFPDEDVGSSLSLNSLIGFSLVGGAVAGGLVMGIRELVRELVYGRITIKPVVEGVIAGSIGAAICLGAIYILALALI